MAGAAEAKSRQSSAAARGKVSFRPSVFLAAPYTEKSNFIMAGAFQCQDGMKENYLKAKSRLAPDLMVAAAEWRMDTFHPWKSLYKEQDRSSSGPQGWQKKLSTYKPEVLCLGWNLSPLKDHRVGTREERTQLDQVSQRDAAMCCLMAMTKCRWTGEGGTEKGQV